MSYIVKNQNHLHPKVGDKYIHGAHVVTITKVNPKKDSDDNNHIHFDNGMQTSAVALGHMKYARTLKESFTVKDLLNENQSNVLAKMPNKVFTDNSYKLSTDTKYTPDDLVKIIKQHKEHNVYDEPLAHDENHKFVKLPDVHRAIAHHRLSTSEHLRFLQQHSPYVTAHVALLHHGNATKDIIDIGLKHHDSDVRAAAAKSKHMTNDKLHEMLSDKSPIVRRAAVSNKNFKHII